MEQDDSEGDSEDDRGRQGGRAWQAYLSCLQVEA